MQVWVRREGIRNVWGGTVMSLIKSNIMGVCDWLNEGEA